MRIERALSFGKKVLSLYVFSKTDHIMKKSTIISAVLMPVLATAAFWLYEGCTISWSLLWAAVPALLMTAGILTGAKAVTNGTMNSVRCYITLVIAPFVMVGLCSMFGIMPLATIAVFLTLPVAIGCSRTMYKSLDGGASVISDLPARTATLQLMFSVLLSLAFIAGKFI